MGYAFPEQCYLVGSRRRPFSIAVPDSWNTAGCDPDIFRKQYKVGFFLGFDYRVSRTSQVRDEYEPDFVVACLIRGFKMSF